MSSINWSLYAHYVTGIYDKGVASQGHSNDEITLCIISSQSTPVTNSNILASMMVTNAHYLATGTMLILVANVRIYFSFIYKNSANELNAGTYTTDKGYQGDQLQPYFNNWQWSDIVVKLF